MNINTSILDFHSPTIAFNRHRGPTNVESVQLPTVIFLEILGFLSAKELALSLRVNKGWNKIIIRKSRENSSVHTVQMIFLQTILRIKPNTITFKVPLYDYSEPRAIMDLSDNLLAYCDKSEWIVLHDLSTGKTKPITKVENPYSCYQWIRFHNDKLILADRYGISIRSINDAMISEEEQKATKEEDEKKAGEIRKLSSREYGFIGAYCEISGTIAGLNVHDITIKVSSPGNNSFNIPMGFDELEKASYYGCKDIIIHDNKISIVFNADERDPLLISPIDYNDAFIDTYSLETKERIFRTEFKNTPKILTLVANANRIACSFSEGKVALISALNHEVINDSLPLAWLKTVEPLEKKVNLYIDNQHLVTVLSNGKIQIWNPTTGLLIKTLERADSPIKKITKFCVHQNLLVVSAGQYLEFWNIPVGERWYLYDFKTSVEGFCFKVEEKNPSLAVRLKGTIEHLSPRLPTLHKGSIHIISNYKENCQIMTDAATQNKCVPNCVIV